MQPYVPALNNEAFAWNDDEMELNAINTYQFDQSPECVRPLPPLLTNSNNAQVNGIDLRQGEWPTPPTISSLQPNNAYYVGNQGFEQTFAPLEDIGL